MPASEFGFHLILRRHCEYCEDNKKKRGKEYKNSSDFDFWN